jgi:hypothetical protein
MEDPEEKTLFVLKEESQSQPIYVCYTTCRPTSTILSMNEVIKISLCVTTLQAILALAFSFSRDDTLWIATFLLFPQVFLYLFMYTNLLSGGWGAPDSRFWCDVKIMYVRGFNTIRTITRMFSLSLGLWLIAAILTIDNNTTIVLIPLLAIISEWQSELSENKNQYDIKGFDKFTKEDDITLCMETLHHFQLQRKEKGNLISSFFISAFIKIYIITCLFATWTGTELTKTFSIPIVVVTVLYICVLPIILDLIYIKSFITFCQLEIYRIIIDVTLPCIIMVFSLV